MKNNDYDLYKEVEHIRSMLSGKKHLKRNYPAFKLNLPLIKGVCGKIDLAAISAVTLDKVLNEHMNGYSYLAMAAYLQKRYDLEGNFVEDMTPEDVKLAKEKLKLLLAKKRETAIDKEMFDKDFKLMMKRYKANFDKFNKEKDACAAQSV